MDPPPHQGSSFAISSTQVTPRVTTFHLPENFNSECDFTITDDLGEPWLKVNRKPWSLRRKTFLFNGRSGEPVALIERKLRSLFRSQGDYLS